MLENLLRNHREMFENPGDSREMFGKLIIIGKCWKTPGILRKYSLNSREVREFSVSVREIFENPEILRKCSVTR